MSDHPTSSNAQAIAAAKRAALAKLLEQRGLKSGARSTLTVRPDPGATCLSYAQRSLWFMDRLTPGSSAYNVSGVFRLRGELNLPALEAALSEVLRRHETLRSRFPGAAGEPSVATSWNAASVPAPCAGIVPV